MSLGRLLVPSPDTAEPRGRRRPPRDLSHRYVSLLRREGFRHEGGLILDGDDQQVEVRTEREAFAVIGWSWRPPEQRWEEEREVSCA